MKKVIKLLLLSTLCACSTRKQDLVRFVEDPANGLRKEVSAGTARYTVQYKPLSYILQLEQVDRTDKEQVAQRKADLGGTAWFNITIRAGEKGESPLRYRVRSQEEYNTRLDYYLNRAAADMYVLYGKDTLYVTDYWFEHNQGLTPHETMVAGFRLPEGLTIPAEDLRFSFYDQVLKNGILKTIINREDIAAVKGFGFY